LISHHPSDATLAAYGAGTLPEGLAMVVATHLGACPLCRGTVAVVQAMGGALLAELPPAPMAPAALERLFARIQPPEPAGPPGTAPGSTAAPSCLKPELPAPLDQCAFGAWWPIGLGLRWRPMRVRGRAWAGLLRAEPGRALWRHRHVGLELTYVLRGSFTDTGLRFHPGDLAEPEAGQDHQPVADNDGPCVCVVASEGVRLAGPLRLVQRLFGS
jgi:putative transcriptional regulator